MEPLLRPANVVVRTLQAFLPGLARPDDPSARTALTDPEYALYMRMDRRDRAHSAMVVRRLKQLDRAPAAELVAAAWLHDVGKAVLPFNPLYRIVVHLWPARPLPQHPLQPGLRGALQLRQHHEAIGAGLIRQAGGRPEVAELVAALGRPAREQPRMLTPLNRADAET